MYIKIIFQFLSLIRNICKQYTNVYYNNLQSYKMI